jgi:hypothetical protein
MTTMAAAIAFAIALPARDARADDKASREAQARFEEGVARVKDGDFEAARISFAQAYAVLHKPDILWNLALAEQKSGHPLEAIGHFKLLQPGLKGAEKAAAAKHVAELSALTAHVDVAAPAGAQVLIDGAAIGVAPLGDVVDVTAGRHHVEIRGAQGGSKAADTDAVTGQVVRVNFIQGETGPGAGGEAAAGVGLEAGASAAPTGASPGAAGSPPSDATAARGSGHATFWDARGITVVTLGGLALVSAGFAIGFAAASNNDASSAGTLRAQNPSCAGSSSAGCQELASTVSSQHGAYVASEGFWIAGVMLAAGAAGAYFLWPRGSESAVGVHVVPSVAPGGAGAIAVGSF